MKRKIPVSPFSTGLSGSAKEMETRIRNILTGGHKRPALLVMAGAAVMIALCGVTVFCFAQAAGGRIENPDPAWFADYYSQDYGTRVYWWEDQPDAPQAHDVRLDAITYLGQTELEGGRIGAAYQVEKSGYDSQRGTLRWSAYEPGIEVAAWTSEGEWLGILGSPNFSVQGLATEQIIRQVDWHLLNWEVSLWRDGCSQPVGIGTQVEGILKPGEEEQTIQPLGEEFAAPIYGKEITMPSSPVGICWQPTATTARRRTGTRPTTSPVKAPSCTPPGASGWAAAGKRWRRPIRRSNCHPSGAFRGTISGTSQGTPASARLLCSCSRRKEQCRTRCRRLCWWTWWTEDNG